jgi:hypothetical protein
MLCGTGLFSLTAYEGGEGHACSLILAFHNLVTDLVPLPQPPMIPNIIPTSGGEISDQYQYELQLKRDWLHFGVKKNLLLI